MFCSQVAKRCFSSGAFAANHATRSPARIFAAKPTTASALRHCCSISADASQQATPRSDSTHLVPLVEKYKDDSPSELQVWRDEMGALVAQHDEIHDIAGCKWALGRVCHHILSYAASPDRTVDDFWGGIMALRFIVDLGERVERLDQDGLSTCAVELFERPWVVTRSVGGAGGRWLTRDTGGKLRPKRPRPLLQLRPRPDGFARRAALAVLSPVIAPIGAMVAYFKTGGANSVAACKWYFRAVTEVPCHVRLDRGYHIASDAAANERDRDVLLAAAAADGARQLVHGSVPQLGTS
mmetsp:Transcript_106208/g.298615  ORF Transcript_106208/g.298615 Transcript_106208/m.298615 type:complete len:296 (-) Transcript_106208:281-1168(-)